MAIQYLSTSLSGSTHSKLGLGSCPAAEYVPSALAAAAAAATVYMLSRDQCSENRSTMCPVVKPQEWHLRVLSTSLHCRTATGTPPNYAANTPRHCMHVPHNYILQVTV